jgi:hypothetical protein
MKSSVAREVLSAHRPLMGPEEPALEQRRPRWTAGMATRAGTPEERCRAEVARGLRQLANSTSVSSPHFESKLKPKASTCPEP